MPEYYFHQSYSRAELLKNWALKEDLKRRKDQGEKDLVIRNRNLTVKNPPPPKKYFLWRTPIIVTGM